METEKLTLHDGHFTGNQPATLALGGAGLPRTGLLVRAWVHLEPSESGEAAAAIVAAGGRERNFGCG